MKPSIKGSAQSPHFQQSSVRTLKSFGHTEAPATPQDESVFPRRTLSFGADDIRSAASYHAPAQTIETTPMQNAQRDLRPAEDHADNADAFHAAMGFANQIPSKPSTGQASSSPPSSFSSEPSSIETESKPGTAVHVPVQQPMLSPMPQSSPMRSPLDVRGRRQTPISMSTSAGAPKHGIPNNKLKGKKEGGEVTLTWITYPKEDPEKKTDYCGEMLQGKRHGVGMLNWQDGASYAGQFEQGKPHGIGYEKYPDGSIYLGQYRKDSRHGLGRIAMVDGKTYSGQWEAGVQHGVGLEVMTIKGTSREIVAVYRRGKRVESYVKTQRNSARLAEDLERVFAVAAGVIQQVQDVTQKVRNTTVGSQLDWEKDIEQEVERRVEGEIERIRSADKERQLREEMDRYNERQPHEPAPAPARPGHGYGYAAKPYADDSLLETVQHRDIATSHGRVPPTSPGDALGAGGGGLGSEEEELAMMSMEKSRIASEIDLVRTLIEQMEDTVHARRGEGGGGEEGGEEGRGEEYFPGGDGAGRPRDRRLMTPLEDVNIRVPSLAFNPFSHVPGLERFSRGPPQATRKRNGPAQKGPRPIKGVQPGDNSGYKGDIVAGMPYGIGSYRDPQTRDHYEGEWVQGLYHGRGRLVLANGIVYDGGFVDGLRHGFGVLEWPSNPTAFPRYEGAFEFGRKHGAGAEGEDGAVVHYVRGCRRKRLDSDALDPRAKAMAAKARGLRERRKEHGAGHPNVIQDIKEGRSVDWSGDGGRGKPADTDTEKNIRWSDAPNHDEQTQPQSHTKKRPARVKQSEEEEEEEERATTEEDGGGGGGGGEEEGWDSEFFTRGGAARQGDRAGTSYGDEESGAVDNSGEVRLIRMAGDDGSEFIGESLNGKPHGLGTIMYSREPPDPEGRVEYAGSFRGGQRHGVGSMLWRDGTNYMGEWKRNRPNGFGFEAYPDGSYYQGTFDNDQRDGVGVYEFANGLYYSGGWRQGRRYGSGIATDINKTKYVLSYDRTGKLLTKHQFSSKAGAATADDAEREVVAEVLRVTLEVRKAAEKARGVAAIELRRRADVGDGAFLHNGKKSAPQSRTGVGDEHSDHWRFSGPQTKLSASALLGAQTPSRVGQSVLKPGHGASG